MNEKKQKIISENINKINDKIYLGGIDGAREIKYLKQEGITHILSLAGKIFSINYEKGTFITKIIEIMDFTNENIFKYFKECIQFIENSKKIYIHCMAGVSRSASIVIAYLMYKEHKKYFQIYSEVKKKRNIIKPNFGFVFQLKYFENLLIENNYDLGKIDFENIDMIEIWNNFVNFIDVK
jgi:protein-tyrosine phosphatase